MTKLMALFIGIILGGIVGQAYLLWRNRGMLADIKAEAAIVRNDLKISLNHHKDAGVLYELCYDLVKDIEYEYPDLYERFYPKFQQNYWRTRYKPE